MNDLEKRLEFATTLAHKAGDIMLKHFQIGVAKEDKADGSPVTVADREVNELVIEEVKKYYPNDGVLGDTLAAISHKKYLDKITHISTGGGAMLEFIENGTLLALEALKH